MTQENDAVATPGGKRVCWAFLSVFAALAAGMILITIHSIHALPQGLAAVPGAQKVTTLSSPSWTSDHEVFVYDGEPKLLDTISGIAVPARGFFVGEGGQICTGTVQVSPDGKLLLWTNGPDSAPLWTIASLRGVETWKRSRSGGGRDSSFAWLPNSRNWVELTVKNFKVTASLYSLDDLKVKQFPLPVSAGALHILGFTPEGDALAVTSPRGTGSPDVRLIQFPLKENGRIVRVLEVPTPALLPSERIQDYQIALAPDGRRLAWLFTLSRPRNAIGVLSSLLTNQMPSVSSVWITDLESNKSHQVLADFSSRNPPDGLDWVKNSKRLSLYYQNSLCTLPAE